MITLTVFLILFYALLIIAFAYGFDKLNLFETDKTSAISNFSIIIPFRNEAENLPSLLDSLTQLNYPIEKFEILLINDASTDNFKNIIKEYTSTNNIHLTIIDNKRKSNSPKKDAIETGILSSKFNWIITTDADCVLPINWLQSFDSFIQKEDPKMIVAPVAFELRNKFITNFQTLDFLSLQGSTMGGFGIHKPFLCNGANLCYQKEAFFEVNGFVDNNNIASGDDIFLLEKITKQFPEKVKYIKSTDVIVLTKPEKSLRKLLQQRIRWASKTSVYNNPFGKMVGLLVFSTNAYLVLLFILAAADVISWQHFGLFFLIKFNVDFLLLYKTSMFFNQTQVLKSYLISSMLHPVFTIIVALLSFKKGYQWKDRTFKK